MPTESYTRTIALEQAGTSQAGVWHEVTSGTDLAAGPGITIGLVFNVQTQTDSGTGSPFELSDDGRALDAPIWVGGGSFTLVNTGSFGGTTTVSLMTTQDLFSTSNLPSIVTGTELLQDTLLVPGSLVVEFDSDMDTTVRALVAGRSTWEGRIAIAVFVESSFATTIGNSGANLISWTEVSLHAFWNGLTGGPYGGKNRFVRDGRFGMPAQSTALGRDGDQPSLWVRSFDVDPEDLEATYRPKPGEGSVDDEVTD